MIVESIRFARNKIKILPIQLLGSLRFGFRAPPSKSSAAYICANHVASGAPEVSAIGLRSAGLANFGCLEIANP